MTLNTSRPADRMSAFVLTDPVRYDRTPDESIAAEAARRGVHPVDVAYDALLENDGRGMIYAPATNFEEVVEKLFPGVTITLLLTASL